MKKAFTLVELIVVITILAILGTIGFISLQGYSAQTRDAKRISDVSSLASKINIETIRGVSLNSLITEDTEVYTEEKGILGNTNQTINTFGKINFNNLRETASAFRDPNGRDYLAAYANSGNYNFFELATISEKENKTKIVGNYYKDEINDVDSLFLTGGIDGVELYVYKNNDTNPIYSLNGNTNPPTNPGNGGDNEGPQEPTYSQCEEEIIDGYNLPLTNHLGEVSLERIENITGGTQKYSKDFICDNGVWENLGEESFIKTNCNSGYVLSENICITPPSGVIDGGTEYSEGSFVWKDLIVSDGINSIIIMDRNLGAIEAGNGTTSYGNYYQWGRNNTGWTNGNSSWSYDWQNPQNDNAWGGAGDITTQNGSGNNISRKGPCPEGYHIPSVQEWINLIKIWTKSRGVTTYSSGTFTWTSQATQANFQNDLKIPLSGHRAWNNGTVTSQGSNGAYWSSSPIITFAYRMYLRSSDVNPQNSFYRSYGFSIRCFKN